MPESPGWERWRPSAYGDYDDKYANMWHKHRDDQGRSGVSRRGNGQTFDAGRDTRSATICNSNNNNVDTIVDAMVDAMVAMVDGPSTVS